MSQSAVSKSAVSKSEERVRSETPIASAVFGFDYRDEPSHGLGVLVYPAGWIRLFMRLERRVNNGVAYVRSEKFEGFELRRFDDALLLVSRPSFSRVLFRPGVSFVEVIAGGEHQGVRVEVSGEAFDTLYAELEEEESWGHAEQSVWLSRPMFRAVVAFVEGLSP